MVALSMLQDTVVVELKPRDDDESVVDLGMKVVKRREPLRVVTMAKAVASGQQSDGTGILIRLLRSDLPSSTLLNVGDVAVAGSGHHWTSLAALSLCGCGLSVSVAYSLMELSLLWYLCYLHFMTYPRNIHQFKDPSSLVEATPQPTSSPPSPRDGSIKVLAFPENRADDIQAEARALARAANATSYTPQLVASKYGSQPIKFKNEKNNRITITNSVYKMKSNVLDVN
ncbi:Putative aarF domain-containing protein kinase, chloroplastic [Glycine soja]|uniref:Putative aarF domain-containing protein kinase, chloroplastic n=1 Tax=Glycine soja TaxID=3848 RepID=A0A0B2QQR4_GLYSO|nr:Putative aarF domain-containing protein kinase, chloroplastic [Glycine soja]